MLTCMKYKFLKLEDYNKYQALTWEKKLIQKQIWLRKHSEESKSNMMQVTLGQGLCDSKRKVQIIIINTATLMLQQIMNPK